MEWVADSVLSAPPCVRQKRRAELMEQKGGLRIEFEAVGIDAVHCVKSSH